MLWKRSKGPSAHCVCSNCTHLRYGWCFDDAYRVWRGFVVTIFMLRIVPNISYHSLRRKKKNNDQKGRYLWKKKVRMIRRLLLLWLDCDLVTVHFRPFSPDWCCYSFASVRRLQGLVSTPPEGFRLSFSAGEKQRQTPTIHLCSQRPPYCTAAIFSPGSGVGSLFSHRGNSLSFFQLIHDGCILASEWVAFIVHSSGFLLLRRASE